MPRQRSVSIKKLALTKRLIDAIIGMSRNGHGEDVTYHVLLNGLYRINELTHFPPIEYDLGGEG